MRKISSVFGLLIGVCVASSASASILSGPHVYPGNGHSYYLLDQAYWTSAEAEAVSLGGHLATVRNAAEDAFISTTFASMVDSGPGNRSLLIGLNDEASEGTFVWVSGEPVGYTNWYPGQPNADRSDSDYVGILLNFGTPGEWHDLLDSGDFNDVTFGVVEVLPEPSAGLLLATTTLLAGLRRRGRRAI